MANRFSPSVLPEPGPRFNPLIVAEAIGMFRREREHELDRKRAEEDRQRRIKFEDEDREHLRGQREREGDLLAAEMHDQGFRPKGTDTLLEREKGGAEVVSEQRRPQAPEMVGVSPLAQRRNELAMGMQDPMVAAQPTRRVPRLPGALDSSRQSFREALAQETAAYEALPSGGFRDLRQTPEAVEQRRIEAQGQAASAAALGIGAPAEVSEAIRINPELLDEYLGHHFRTEQSNLTHRNSMERARYASDAATARAKMVQDRIDARGRPTAATGQDGSLTRRQALELAQDAVMMDPNVANYTPSEIAARVSEIADQYMGNYDGAGGGPIDPLFEAEGTYRFPAVRVQRPVSRADTRPATRGGGSFADQIGAAADEMASGFDPEEARALAEAGGFTAAELQDMGFSDEEIQAILGEA